MYRRLPARLSGLLPQGRMLPDEVWRRRHRAIVVIAGVQALALAAIGPFVGADALTSLFAALAVAYPLLFLALPGAGRGLQAAATTTSLLAASVALVALLDGLTEAHFHFFVVIGIVSLYQSRMPFGAALLVVLGHHGVIGKLAPQAVFGHDHATSNPWTWAALHGGFVLAASLAHLAAWRLNEQQELRDPLTGLANRTQLVEAADRRLACDPRPVSVLLLDVDDFRDVNDARGHAAGDRLLVAVGRRIAGCVRPGDQVARLGGDEFAVLVDGGPELARTVGERILLALADPIAVDGRPVALHVSAGVADTETAGERDAVTLLRNADLAMYMAKALGKNRLVHYADGMAQAARNKAELLQDLTVAIPAGQFEVHYQPTVDLPTGTTTGYEALLRWHHPTRGLVPPAEFIPLAEEGAHIVAIGRWVLTEATRQAATWSAEAERPIGIAVNLSPRQLADDDVVTTVRDALAGSGLPPRQLTLEVTEGVLVHDVDAVVAQLRSLRALGVRIAIDDFGTGYSSLSYLRRLPADIVKIDRSFVQDLETGIRTRTLVASIIELARSLHLDVVAEGVETEGQHAVLRGLACSHAQGYLFGRPQPAAVQTPAGDRVPAVRLPAPRCPTPLVRR
ncbi:putative bifunctional diguanylate cyclase/phosphodiesterase [Geodermatophilus sp. CPCC 206100]|uniref:putative bifunctional diguanylate cyclase/phosphodiesterase n=1 Tax=Geodermatophilus sp. CPCC 206100 TaxID=3020054 RepID=UPI003AFF778E